MFKQTIVIVLLVAAFLVAPLYAEEGVPEVLERFARERGLAGGEEYQKFWQQGLQSFHKEFSQLCK